MKKSRVLVKSGIAILGLVIVFTTITSFASTAFSDLSPMHWCYKKIMEFVDKGYIDGYEDGTMKPDQTITRAEYVKIVNNFFGFKGGKTNKEFVDVPEDAWYKEHVYTAVSEGYISGYEDNTFRPNNPITRQEATVILSRILNIDREFYPKDHVDGLAQYPDGYEVDDWAYTPIHSYSVYNFINGYEDGMLRILQNVTRAETVELLHILEQKIEIGTSTSRKNTVKMPTIALLKQTLEENASGDSQLVIKSALLTKSGWINKMQSTTRNGQDGVLVNITSTTENATVNESLEGNKTKNRNYITTKAEEIDNALFLIDGEYKVLANASKKGYKSSSSNEKEILVDTKAPEVSGEVVTKLPEGTVIALEHFVKVNVVDPKFSNVNRISGINKEKLRYAWFREGTNGEYNTIATDWTKFEIDEKGFAIISTGKLEYGKYKLGISAIDIAENAYGTRIYTTFIKSGDEDAPFEEIPYDFVGKISGDPTEPTNPDGTEEPGTPVDIVVVIGKKDSPSIETKFKKINFIDSGDSLRAEPGDTIEYNLNITNSSETENVDLNITFDKDVIVKYSNASGEKVTQPLKKDEKLVGINLKVGENIEIEVYTDVPNDYKIGTDFKISAKIDMLQDSKVVGTSTATATNEIEKSAVVFNGEVSNKNIVLIIDKSVSMLSCCTHKVSNTKDKYRFPKDYDYENHPYSYRFIKDTEGYIYSYCPYVGHEYKVNGEWKKCKDESRIDVVRASLNSFVTTVTNAAKTNGEDITITLITFCGSPLKGLTYVFEANKDNTEKINNLRNNIKDIVLDKGTDIQAGVTTATEVFEKADMIENAENHVIFFGDGSGTAPTEAECEALLGKVDRTYAIGFGPDFASNDTNAYKILKSIVGTKGNVTRASTAADVLVTFAGIADEIAKPTQSRKGVITAILPKDGSYYPINFKTESGDSTDIVLFTVNSKSDFELYTDELELIEQTASENGKILWNISGEKYSKYEKLKIELTVGK